MFSETIATIEPAALSQEEIRHYHDLGYVGPFAMMPPTQMERICREVTESVLNDESRVAGRAHCRHLDKSIIWELCSHPAIVRRMRSLLGDDLILWRSHLFDKPPGSEEIPFHQDINYWPIEPGVNISAWVALTEATVENSCVQVIPGSHKKPIPHIPSLPGQASPERADPAFFDPTQAKAMELRPGEFFLFTEKLLHYSASNTSGRRRLGLAVRVTVPFVKVDHARLGSAHKCIQLSGRDTLGFNEMAAPPTT